MDPFEEKLKLFISEHKVDCVHFHYEQSCHSVEDAMGASGASREDFIKSICMVGSDGSLHVGIVSGEDKVSQGEVGRTLGKRRPQIATPEQMLEKTGYPCGGTPPFGFPATFIIDPRVMERDIIWGGGGSEQSLIRITPKEMARVNGGTVARIRK